MCIYSCAHRICHITDVDEQISSRAAWIRFIVISALVIWYADGTKQKNLNKPPCIGSLRTLDDPAIFRRILITMSSALAPTVMSKITMVEGISEVVIFDMSGSLRDHHFGEEIEPTLPKVGS